MNYVVNSPEMVKVRSDLNTALDTLGKMRDDAARDRHPQARDLSIAITHVEDAFFRVNRAAHTP